jgi:hypothetical protein
MSVFELGDRVGIQRFQALEESMADNRKENQAGGQKGAQQSDR